MPRDLDSFTVPDEAGGPGRRVTEWQPGDLRVGIGFGNTCGCPCRIAHPSLLDEQCVPDALAVGAVAVDTSTDAAEPTLLPLCGPCAAAQVSRFRDEAEQEWSLWSAAVRELAGYGAIAGLAALLLAVALGDFAYGVWFVCGLLFARGVVAFELWRLGRRVS